MTCCHDAAVIQDLRASQPASDSLSMRESELRASSVPQENGMLFTRFSVPEIHCSSCINRIEGGLAALDGVSKVRTNLTAKSASITWNPSVTSASTISETLTTLGFAHTVSDGAIAHEGGSSAVSKRLLLSMAVAGFAAANIMLLSVSVWSGATAETERLFHLISGLIAVPAISFAGQVFFRSALAALRGGHLNMDVPISLAILLSLALSLYESLLGEGAAYYDAAVMLTFFLLIGRYLDNLMREKARGALRSLANLSAKGATLVTDGEPSEYIALHDIQPGMVLRVLAGDRLPVDGRIVKGEAYIDRSLVTGESEPVASKTGDVLEAGVLNLSGPLDIVSTSTSTTSFLAEMTRMMDAAEQGRGFYVRLADRAARIYAPAVHLAALATFLGWMIYSGDWHLSITIAIAVLIITCPCALGLAVPIVHVLGARRLLNEGILMRDGSALERLAEIDTVIFDKTGTLTSGRPRVTKSIHLLASEKMAVASLAQSSSHPAAFAVRQLVDDGQTTLTAVKEIVGQGVEGEIDGKKVRFGRRTWVGEISRIGANSSQGSAVWYGKEDEKAICFPIADSLRPEANGTITSLQESGLNVEILSGDASKVVRDVAEELSIQTHRASLTPQEKIDRIEQLKHDGRAVFMVGDGLNDAPALAAGHVSMAPSTGSDIGRTASDFVFTKPGLGAVAYAHRVSLAASRLVRQNFAIALIYNLIAVPLAVAGYVTPLIAALAMSGSSIAVLLNSMRLTQGRFDLKSLNLNTFRSSARKPVSIQGSEQLL